jgi:HEAT repeat protein
VALLGIGLLSSARGLAEGPSPRPFAATPAPISLSRGALAKLKSADAGEIEAGLDEARLAAKAALPAVPIIVDLLEKGLPLSLTQRAVDTLGDIESEQASSALSFYTRHRDLAIRRSAVKAIVRTKGAPAVKALRAALSDPDPTVRSVAATGLGSLRAKEAVGDLFVALDHRVNDAAVSIGELCAPAECESLEGRLGRIPFDIVTSGLDPILFRPPSEVSDDAKVKLIGRVRELGTAEANKFLRDVQARWPETGSERIKKALELGVQATAAGASSKEP